MTPKQIVQKLENLSDLTVKEAYELRVHLSEWNDRIQAEDFDATKEFRQFNSAGEKRFVLAASCLGLLAMLNEVLGQYER